MQFVSLVLEPSCIVGVYKGVITVLTTPCLRHKFALDMDASRCDRRQRGKSLSKIHDRWLFGWCMLRIDSKKLPVYQVPMYCRSFSVPGPNANSIPRHPKDDSIVAMFSTARRRRVVHHPPGGLRKRDVVCSTIPPVCMVWGVHRDDGEPNIRKPDRPY